MASVQQANNDKAKAAVAEAIHEAKSFLAKNNVANVGQHQPAVSAGAIKNGNVRPIKRYRSHNFRGNFIAMPSEEIGKFASTAFLHQGEKNLPALVGSKGAVIYGTLDSNLPEALGWLLAFDNPDHPTLSAKVYVEAGFLGRFLQMDWNEIERKLDASSDESCYAQGIGPAACAKIEKLNEKVALIGANFDYIIAQIPSPIPSP